MRNLFIFVLSAIILSGCSSYPVYKVEADIAASCVGSTDLPADLADQFTPAEDQALLQNALGQQNEGKLCQGRVYQTKPDAGVVVFRAWNSTNPNSRFGQWWAFQTPVGKVAAYRADYAICYQWSPLDKLVRCTLKPEVKVVVGTGQSAECSQYLTYPVSAEQQIYLENAAESVVDCAGFDGEFSWK